MIICNGHKNPCLKIAQGGICQEGSISGGLLCISNCVFSSSFMLLSQFARFFSLSTSLKVKFQCRIVRFEDR